MADFPKNPLEDEGGPVKIFLEHLEDFRWLLIKCAVTLALTMLVCLIGGQLRHRRHQMAADAGHGQLIRERTRSSASASAPIIWAIIPSRRNSSSC